MDFNLSGMPLGSGFYGAMPVDFQAFSSLRNFFDHEADFGSPLIGPVYRASPMLPVIEVHATRLPDADSYNPGSSASSPAFAWAPSASNWIDTGATVLSGFTGNLAANAGVVMQNLTTFEASLVNHVVNMPSIVNTMAQFTQFLDGMLNNNPQKVASAGVGISSGMLVGEAGTYIAGVLALPQTSSLVMVGALVLGAAKLSDYAMQNRFDAAWNSLSENARDSIINNMRNNPMFKVLFGPPGNDR